MPEPRGVAFTRSWLLAVYQRIWSDFLVRPLDEMPMEQWRIQDILKPELMSGEWYRCYDLIEFLLEQGVFPHAHELATAVSRILDQERAGFRLSEGRFIEITDERELAAIEDAIALAVDRFAPVRRHLDTAVALYSDRRAPDFRNSIKESISAVESVVQIVTGDPRAELTKALGLIHTKAPLHGAFASALKSLYGYTSDASGIRHALTDEPTLDAADAKFMLVACAGFVVYLIQKTAP